MGRKKLREMIFFQNMIDRTGHAFSNTVYLTHLFRVKYSRIKPNIYQQINAQLSLLVFFKGRYRSVS